MRTPPWLPLLSLLACTKPRDPNSTLVPASPALATNNPAAGPGPARPALRAPECLCEHGVPRMVQITRADLRAGSHQLALFAPFYFVFEEEHDAQGRAMSYRLGTTRWRDSLLTGKVPADAVAVWSSVVGAFPLGRVNVYATFADVERLARTGTTCDPIAVSPASSVRRPFLWPIVETRQLSIDGVTSEAWRIHFVGRAGDATTPAPQAAPRYTDAELDAMQRDLRGLDVAWVIDATGSMEPFWHAAKSMVQGMTTRLARGVSGPAPDVRFGLVAFRDHDSSSQFVTRSKAFGDEANFLAALGEVPIDHGGSLAEAGLDALDAALALDWRTSRLTTRVVVLVSDASYHDAKDAENPRNLATHTLAARARELGVHVVGLAVGQQANTDDRARQLAQYRELAAATSGTALAIEASDAAVEHIAGLMRGAATQIEKRSSVLTALTRGASSADALAAATKLSLDDVTQCLEFLSGALELQRLAPGEPAFASGWVLPTRRGVQQLDMRVLLSRGDCELLRDACRRVIADLSDRPESIAAMVGIGVGGRGANAALFGLVEDPRADLALHLAARHKLVFRKDSVLRLTQAEIQHMSEQDRRARLDGVALALRRITEFERDADLWFSAHGTSYAFAPEEVLP